MFFRSSPKAARRRPTPRLAVEALDRRDNPSTGVALSGTTLNIVGDNGANSVQVAIVDATDQVLVKADGHTFAFASDQVKAINVNLNGGNDDLTVQLGTGTEPAVTLTRAKAIAVNLGDGDDSANFVFGGLGVPGRVIAADLSATVHAGAGNDSVIGNFGETKAALTVNTFMGTGDDASFVNLWGPVDAGAAVKIGMHGEAGNDSMGVFATYVTGYDQVNIGTGARLDIGLNGGDGNDRLDTTYGGIDRGTLRVREDGAAGNDTVTAQIHLVRPPFTLFPVGVSDVVLRGGSGFDNLELDVFGKAHTFRAEIDGGSGFDHATGTSNVQIINANEWHWLPPRPPIGGVFQS
jgi:hypothetical protein